MKKLVLSALLLVLPATAMAGEIQRRTFLDTSFDRSMGQVKVAFFDADSTLRVSRSGKVSANSPTDVEVLPQVGDKIAELASQGYLVAIVSNQGGIGKAITMETADGALRFTIDGIRAQNPKAVVHYYDFAENDDSYRKPGTGMALELEQRLSESFRVGIDWKHSFMVGDSAYKKDKDITPKGALGTHFSNSDRLFAENLMREKDSSFRFHEPTDFFGWRSSGVDVFLTVPEVCAYYDQHPRLKRSESCPQVGAVQQ